MKSNAWCLPTEIKDRTSERVWPVVYGLVGHVTFLLIFLYLILFLGNFDSIVPKTIDSGLPGPVGVALIINIILLGLFAIPHSVMARPGFKQWWTQFVPKPVERSTYVLFSNLLVILLFWQWRTMTGVVWEVENEIGANLLWAVNIPLPSLRSWGSINSSAIPCC